LAIEKVGEQLKMGLPSTKPGAGDSHGWVLYDGDCAVCIQFIQTCTPLFLSTSLKPIPLQTEWVKQRLGFDETENSAELLKEMRVLTAQGQIYGGADAVIYLARQFWWSRPFVYLAALPGGHFLIDRVYRWIASNRHCSAQGCSVKR
jgi:predicted DCC family thiol-disulfide oxidoreductase YuxK